MSDIQTISATKARANFFQILDQAILENKTFIIKKGKIPVARITPPQPQKKDEEKEKNLKLLQELAAFRKTLPFQEQSSVEFIRAMRQDRLEKYD